MNVYLTKDNHYFEYISTKQKKMKIKRVCDKMYFS